MFSPAARCNRATALLALLALLASAAAAVGARQVNVAQSGGGWNWQMSSGTAGVVSGSGNYPRLNLEQGDAVTFTGRAGSSHWFAVAPGGTHAGSNNGNALFDQLRANKGTSFQKTLVFGTAGEYVYYCPPHSNMVGRITVAPRPQTTAGAKKTTPTRTTTTTTSSPDPTTRAATVLPAAKYTVVGAGPGGVLAAHILAQAAAGEARLLERGGMPNDGTYTYPFAANYNVQPTFLAASYNGDGIPLTKVFGGQQATNGGVYSPGTAADLAAALGISEASAAAAQACASRSIDWTPEPARPALAPGTVPNIGQQKLGSDHSSRYGYLAECSAASGTSGCAWGDMLFASTAIRRRTVAQKLHGGDTPPAYTLLDTEVKRVVFGAAGAADRLTATAVEFADGTIAPVKPGGAVVLAAGAMGSNAILARSSPARFGSFSTMHNHYYQVAYQGSMYDATTAHMDQWFTEFKTAGDAGLNCAGQTFELQLNGNYPVSNALVQLVVLQMEPEMRGSGGYNSTTGTLDITDAATACDTVARAQAAAIVKESWGVVGGRAFDSPYWGLAPWSQSWHWAGGLPLEDGSSRIKGTSNVYSGDTGALRNPFSCHTSMPSAAAGIVAAMQILGKEAGACGEYVPVRDCTRRCEREQGQHGSKRMGRRGGRWTRRGAVGGP